MHCNRLGQHGVGDCSLHTVFMECNTQVTKRIVRGEELAQWQRGPSEEAAKS